MNELSSGGSQAMQKTVVLSFAAVLLLATGCQVDVTKLACTSSAECPTGYHCDMGTATSAGTFKCANGAAQQRTLAADATKFLLATRPSADGTVRRTVSAGLGAVTATPDFVGVRVIAKQGTTDIAESQVRPDGSVLQFELPGVVAQISLRVQDDSGHSVAVTGYKQQVVMSFAGKDVPGNVNPITAYDAATATDSLFAPTDWIATLTEIPATSPVTNSVASPAAYNGLASIDGVYSNTTVAPQPVATTLGWEQIAQAPTAVATGLQPSPRSGAAIAQLGISVGGNSYSYIAYGGIDGAGAVADTSPTIYAFSQYNGIGWATVPTNVSTTSSPFPSRFMSFGVDNPITRAGAAMGGTFAYSPGGINYAYSFFIAGGTDTLGSMTDKIYAYGDRITTSNGNKFSGWWDETAEFAGAHLAQPNADMAYAPLFNLPVPQTASTSPFQFAGAVLVGGRSNAAGAINDASGCQYITSTSYQVAPSFQVRNCTADPSLVNPNQWLTATGGIGYRTGAALTPTDNSGEGAVVYLFGGSRSGATSSALNGPQNDLWKGTISVVCNPVNAGNAPPPCTTTGATISTQISWTAVSIAATPKPSQRSGAMIAFGEFRKLVLYGGDAAGPLNDVWELDMSGSPPFTWRQLTLDAAPALAPGARTNGALMNSYFDNNSATLLFGGATGAGPTSDVWVLSRQSAGRLLVKAPAGLAAPDLATNMTMSIRSMAAVFFGAPIYIWNGSGSRWEFVSNEGLGSAFASLPQPLAYLQPDGSFYFLFNSRNRSTPTSSNTANLVSLDGLEVTLDFQ